MWLYIGKDDLISNDLGASLIKSSEPLNMSVSPLSVAEQIDVAIKVLDRTLSFFPRADSRAQVMLGVNVGLLFTLGINFPVYSTANYVHLIWLAPVLLLGFSLYKLYEVAFPQLDGGIDSLIYFNEISKHTEGQYSQGFLTMDANTYLKDLLAQVFRNSQILSSKFQSLKESMIATGMALPVWLIALAISAVADKLTLK